MNKENKDLIEKARIRIKCSYCESIYYIYLPKNIDDIKIKCPYCDESLYLSLYDLL